MKEKIKIISLFWLLAGSTYLIYKYKNKNIYVIFYNFLKKKKKIDKLDNSLNEFNELRQDEKNNKKYKEEKKENEKKVIDVEDITNINERSSYKVVQIKKKKNNSKYNDENINKNNQIIIPENFKIYFKTFGCSHNNSDSEFMMGLLSNYGFKFVKTIEECDICIVNSCTVKNPSEESMKSIIKYVEKLNMSNEMKKDKKRKEKTNECYSSSSFFSDFSDTSNKKKNSNKNKKNKKIKIIVCGCVPQADKEMKELENISLIGVNNIDKIIDVVENVINGYTVKYLNNNNKVSLNLPKIRKNKYIEIININNGCLGNCTYCKTKFARGDLVSYTIEEIVSRINIVCNEENIKEIWLTSEDTGAYGIDINTNIVELLKEILKNVENMNIMIRLGMTNPPYILNHIEQITEILKHKNMYEFIHIPVQSGSNDVLKNMNREYVIEDFTFLVDKLKENVQNITISTDIICGFPMETEENHKRTLQLIEKYKFPILNISHFYPRTGTKAFYMKKINTKIVKERSKQVTDLFHSYTNYEYLLNTIQKVLFTDISSKTSHIIGHTKQYVKVLLENQCNENQHLLGQFAFCKIISTHKWHVIGTLISI